MFSLLLAKARTESIQWKTNTSNVFPKREAIQEADDIACHSEVRGYSTYLNGGVEYCYKVRGSFFINAKPVNIKGYVDGVKKFEGRGVFATVGMDGDYHNYTVIIRSDTYQEVTIFSSISLLVGYPYYITTKSKIDEFNIVQKSMYSNGYYYSNLIHLGPRTTEDVDTDFDYPSELQMAEIGYDSYMEVSSDVTQHFSSIKGLHICGKSYYSYDTINVKIKSHGDEWVTPMDGYVTIQECHVYNESEFEKVESNGLSTGAIIGIVFVAVFVVLMVFIISIFVIRSKRSAAQNINEVAVEVNAASNQNNPSTEYQQNYGKPPYEKPAYPQQSYDQSPYTQPTIPQQNYNPYAENPYSQENNQQNPYA